MEERELDEDLGLTIKIKKNKDGLNEVVDENADEQEETGAPEEGEVVVALPDDEEEDREEFADLTPEEAEAILKEQEEAARLLQEKTDSLLRQAEEYLKKGDAVNAEECYWGAVEGNPFSLEANVKYAAMRTKDFTDYSSFDHLQEAYDDGEAHCGEEFRLAIKHSYADPIFKEIKLLADKADKIGKEVTAKREERRAVFKRDYLLKKRAFLISIFPLALFALLTVIFAFNIASVKDSTFLILTVVGAACSLVALTVFLVTGNQFSTAQHRLAANERDESTKLGRELVDLKEKISYLSNIVK